MSGSDSDFRADRRAELVYGKLAGYLRAIPPYLQDPNGGAKSVLEQSLKELIWAQDSSGSYAGLHEKLLAKDEDSWLFYLSEVDYAFRSPKYFREVKDLSPFRDRTLYRRDTRCSRIVLDPAQLDGVSIL